jgi:hypothetical protein
MDIKKVVECMKYLDSINVLSIDKGYHWSDKTPSVHMGRDEFKKHFQDPNRGFHDDTTDKHYVVVDGVEFFTLVDKE